MKRINLQSLKRSMLIPVAIVVIMAIVVAVSSCQKSQKNYTGKIASINFGAVPTGDSALVYIAQDQHFFAANGLKVNVKDYPTGVMATDALLKGEVEIAWSSEFPLVRRAFEKDHISTIVTMNRFTYHYLFARRDLGIEKITDLKGCKIGVVRTTNAEFYLSRFLMLNGVNAQDVSLVNIKPEASVRAIADGSLDGVVAREPYSSKIRSQLAGKIVTWSVQSNQPGYSVISARNDWIHKNPEVVKRFLKSLAQAQDYLVHNPEASKAIVQAGTHSDRATVETFWSEAKFGLSLDQSLIAAMEDEARWMITNNLTTERKIPDFSNYIYEDGLKEVKPEAVNIIR